MYSECDPATIDGTGEIIEIYHSACAGQTPFYSGQQSFFAWLDFLLERETGPHQMTDFLKSIGLGSGAVDPAALLKQKAVDDQIKSLRGQLTSLANTIDLTAKSGQLLGVPQTYLDKLTTLKDKTNGFAESTKMSPTDLYNKLKELDTEYKGLLAVQDKKIDGERLEKGVKAVDAVRARIKEVEDDSTTSPALREKYQGLLLEAEQMISKMEVALAAAREAQAAAVTEGFRAATAAAKKEGFQSADELLGVTATSQTGDAESILGALFPKIPMSASFFETSPTTILDRLRLLDLEKEEEEAKTFSPVRALKRWAIKVKRIFWFAFLCIGGLIGGVILSNFYIDEPFWGIKIFYFLVGVVLFPFMFLLGLIAPPYWHSTLIPLVEVGGAAAEPQTSGADPKSTPEIQGSTPAAAAAAAGATVVENPSIGWFQSLYSYEPVTRAAIDNRLAPTKTPMRVVSGVGLIATAGMMLWNDFFKYLAEGEAVAV